MAELKITKGNWSYCDSEVCKHRPYAVLVEGTGSMIADVYQKTRWDESIPKMTLLDEETEANAQLIADAGTTANKSGLLPSELLEQRDILCEALNELMQNLGGNFDSYLRAEKKKAKKALKLVGK